MDIENIYEEKISFLMGKLAFLLMVVISLLMLFFYLYQLVTGPLGTKPAPDWFYLVMFVSFIGISYLVGNFRNLTTKLSSQGITVAYGKVKYSVTWDNIRGGYLDSNPGSKYGGWGIRLGNSQGRWVLVYNATNAPVVVLELATGRFGYLAFSTRHAEDVIGIIEQHAGK